MTIKFRIDEHVTVNLNPGTYEVFIIGGFNIRTDKDFTLRVDSSQKMVTVREKLFKARCLKNWRKAIKYFEFKIDVPGEYFISFRNLDGIEIRRSQLLLKRIFQKPVSRDNIQVIIEPK